MKLIWERMKIIIEPSCATPFAVVMSPEFKQLEGIDKIGIKLTGGNIDLSKFTLYLSTQSIKYYLLVSLKIIL